MEGNKHLYLGIDFSTQKGKIIAVDENLCVVYEDNVSYDEDLPEFGTVGGVHVHADQLTITVPTAMMVKALDMLLDRMAEAKFPFEKVIGIGGDNQAIGTVYWKHGARSKLQGLKVDMSLYEQLKDVFSIPEATSHMDSSTEEQCCLLDEIVGGPTEMQTITGSRAAQSSGAAQILKVCQTRREAYDNTERISLFSSFTASLFLGDYAPIDYSDGATMNLLDIRTKKWSPKCLQAFPDNLCDKLGEPAPTQQISGRVSPYLRQKYNFSPECKLLNFTADGLQSFLGTASQLNELVICMGTADLVDMWHSTPFPTCGNALIHPLNVNSYITFIVFINGSLTRQRIMEKCAGNWETFAEMFHSTPPGNNGNIGIYFDNMERMPPVKGIFRFNEHNEKVEMFPPAVEVRAVLEGQFLARRMYAEQGGLLGASKRILATGGASQNKEILQVKSIAECSKRVLQNALREPSTKIVRWCEHGQICIDGGHTKCNMKNVVYEVDRIIADIFNLPVYTIDVPNSSALGGCYRAKLACDGLTEIRELKGLPEPVNAATPTPGLEKVYSDMLERYRKLEEQVVSEFNAE